MSVTKSTHTQPPKPNTETPAPQHTTTYRRAKNDVDAPTPHTEEEERAEQQYYGDPQH